VSIAPVMSGMLSRRPAAIGCPLLLTVDRGEWPSLPYSLPPRPPLPPTLVPRSPPDVRCRLCRCDWRLFAARSLAAGRGGAERQLCSRLTAQLGARRRRSRAPSPVLPPSCLPEAPPPLLLLPAVRGSLRTEDVFDRAVRRFAPFKAVWKGTRGATMHARQGEQEGEGGGGWSGWQRSASGSSSFRGRGANQRL
jgi:hypothetical protein